nr:2K peptide [dengue virus type 3]
TPQDNQLAYVVIGILTLAATIAA